MLIAGVGNPYRCDDGIGVEVIKTLNITYARNQNYFGITLFDSGTDGLALFDQLSLHKRALIIDAVCMGDPPGTVKLFTPKDAKLKITSDALSTHGFGLADVLKLVDEFKLDVEIKILGIQPQNVDFGEGFSEAIKGKIPEIFDLIRDELKSL
jgi:hydrogenase maturation protease